VLWHFQQKFTANSLLSLLAKIFKTSQHLAKLQARKLIVSRTLCAWALSCWKTKNSLDILSTVFSGLQVAPEYKPHPPIFA